MKGKGDVLTLTIKIDVAISWRTAVKMRLMGQYPAAIIARAIADRIREVRE